MLSVGAHQEHWTALGGGRPRGAQTSFQYVLLGRSEKLFFLNYEIWVPQDPSELSGQSSQIFISVSLAAA